MTDRIGQQLGNYRLLRLLGQGGSAEVYLGEHVYLKSQAAIKVLSLTLSSTEQSDFLLEARRLVDLKHPHIIRVLDFALDDDIPFLVMEYASHGTMRTYVPKGACLPLADIVSYVKQAADALHYIHKQNLVHCDVKPENMLLGDDQALLLSDFGIVATAYTTGSLNIIRNQAGTPPYMAPEQILNMPRPESDQYALGIIVYEWLCGQHPFDGLEGSKMHHHLQTAPPPLRTFLPTISPTIENVVLRAIAKEPKKRFASVQAFALALELAYQREEQSHTLPSAQSIPSVLLPVSQLPTIAFPSSQLPIEVFPTVVVEASLQTEVSTAAMLPVQSMEPLTSNLARGQFLQDQSPLARYKPKRVPRRKLMLGLGIAGLACVGGGFAWLITPRPGDPRTTVVSVPRLSIGKLPPAGVTSTITSTPTAPQFGMKKVPPTTVTSTVTSTGTVTPVATQLIVTIQTNLLQVKIGQTVPVVVTTNQPNIPVILHVSYNFSGYNLDIPAQFTDIAGQTTFSWPVPNIQSAFIELHRAYATLVATANNAQGVSVQSPSIHPQVVPN